MFLQGAVAGQYVPTAPGPAVLAFRTQALVSPNGPDMVDVRICKSSDIEHGRKEIGDFPS
jgi:hypothetical protein